MGYDFNPGNSASSLKPKFLVIEDPTHKIFCHQISGTWKLYSGCVEVEVGFVLKRLMLITMRWPDEDSG